VIVAHDLGTTGDKAALYAADGTLVAAVTARYRTDYKPGGRVEQDPADWWGATVTATRELLERVAVRSQDVACVSFSGQMMGAVLLDGAGDPVRPAVIWADTRSSAECDELVAKIGMERAYAITGHRLNPTYSLTKAMWVRRHEPAAWARTRKVVLAKDYVAFRLTGVLATDPSDASSTNAFDQAAGTWSQELLDAAGVDRALLPDVVPSTTVLGGGVTAEAAQATGLAAGTPVVLGGGDGPCAALGAGIVSAASGAYTYLGSSSWVSMAADAPLHDPQMRTMTFNHVLPGRFVPTATMQAGGGSMEWITDLLSPGGDAGRFARLGEAAASVEAADDGLLFLPHLLGERSPYWNPRARGAFIGLARHHGRGHLVRAVMEGVAMNLYTGLAAFEEMGAAIDTVDAIGGGAASDLWLQVLADVWGKTVRRRSLGDEANALGAAVIGGVAVGLFDSFDVAPGFSDVQATFAPDAGRHARYATRYAQFLDVYRRLEPVFDVL
jgi:xylulokinase